MREVIQGRNYAAPAPAVRYSYCKKTNKIEQTKLADMENKSCISRISKGKKTSVAYVNTHTHIYMYIHNKIYEKQRGGERKD